MTIKSPFGRAGTPPSAPSLLIDEVFDSIRMRDYDGRRMSVEESLENMRTLMELNFEGIAERGEFNGMKIKDPSKIVGLITERNYLNDFLNAAVTFQTKRHSLAKGEIARLDEIDNKIAEGIETWLQNVRILEEKGLIDKGITGKPLSDNNPARETDKIYGRLRDVLSSNGRTANPLISDNDARERLAKDPTFNPQPAP